MNKQLEGKRRKEREEKEEEGRKKSLPKMRREQARLRKEREIGKQSRKRP